MTVSWMRDGDTLYGELSGGNHRLIVEALPGGTLWDWAVWRQSHRPETLGYGVALTAAEAMSHAESCVSETAQPAS